MSIRVYQLAKDLGLDSKEVAQLLRERGLKIASASSSIPNIYADALIEELRDSVLLKAVHPSGSSSNTGATKEDPVPERKEVSVEPSENADSSVVKVKASGSTVSRGQKAPGVPKLKITVEPRSSLRVNVIKKRVSIEETASASIKTEEEKVENRPAVKESDEVPVEGEQLESPTEIKEKIEENSEHEVTSTNSPSVPKFIKIPLPKNTLRTPKAFVSQQDEAVSKKENQQKDFNSKKSNEGVVIRDTASNRVSEKNAPSVTLPQKKAPTVNFNEKRAAPSVSFRGVTKRPNTQLVNSIPLPGDEKDQEKKEEKPLVYKVPVIVRDFAQKIGLKPFQLISILMRRGIFASMTQQISDDVAIEIAAQQGFKLEIRQKGDGAKQNIPKPKIIVPKELLPRPPVVCVLGHVDHGKTTLLDTIRHASVVAGEAGGITQHTGAYQVECEGKKITFLDTPGHAAFSNMRERGAEVTDIAILVVAADDGFMPQTDEALKFAQKAGVPVVVAINKIDAKGANFDRVKQQMQQRGIAPEDWGGDTLCVGISALKGTNIDELLSLVLLQAEMMELKADYKCPAVGVIIESQIDIGRGPVATVIVQEGTLKVGDALVCGSQYCRVRSMLNERAETVKAATPAMAVKVIGWSSLPENGDLFETVKDEKTAKRRAEEQADLAKKGQPEPAKIANMKALFEAMAQQQQKVLRVIVKGDVQGTVEALVGCLEAIKSDKVKLEILNSGVGAVSKNDVEFAHSSEALIVGFNVKMDNGVAPLAKNKGVRILLHNIIYELIDQVREEMAELLDYEYTESHLGTAEIRQVFVLAKGTIAGCMVTEGQIVRDKPIRVMRKGKVLFEGKVDSLKRQKEDQSEVRSGFECGIKVDGYSDFEEGDTLESFEMVKHRQTL